MDKHNRLHDTLGRLHAEAVLAAERQLGRHTGVWYLDSITAELGRGLYRWDSFAAAVADLAEAGYTVSNAPCNLGGDYTVVHLATAAEIAAKGAAEAEKFANAEKGFIRFGPCPKSGQSRNSRDNCNELGVSAFEAEFAGREWRVKIDQTLEPTYHLCCHRQAYRLYGEVVGTGADGEPVLKVKKAVKI